MDGERLAEVGRVHHVDLQKEHVRQARDRVGAALLAFLGGVLGFVAGLAPVGDDVIESSWARLSAMNRRASSSKTMRSARSSVVRATREISDTVTMPRMKNPEMAMPSGLSMMLAPRA
ncbi:hypothetical protein ABTZ58_39205 [Streptomyces sp. NPDC094143]|uniref:hypothetical protein n=1 Tax=Streptomyces sp. NPDC094143 TaxID=3155310 RepID=UPI003333235D